MSNMSQRFGTTASTAFKNPKAKMVLPIVFISVILVLSIVIGALRTNADGKDDCDCMSKSNAGWRGFSITWFIGTLFFMGWAIFAITRSKTLKGAMGFS
jgi:hypothetical protein